MSSSIPAARAALLAALRASADPAFDGVRFLDVGEWTEPLPQGARITVETSREVTRDWAGLGQLRLEETFVLVASIEILYAGRSLDVVEARLWELVAAVEKTVLQDVTLGGAVRTARPDGAPDGETIGPSTRTGGAAAAIDLRFACQQRIQLI